MFAAATFALLAAASGSAESMLFAAGAVVRRHRAHGRLPLEFLLAGFFVGAHVGEYLLRWGPRVEGD